MNLGEITVSNDDQGPIMECVTGLEPCGQQCVRDENLATAVTGFDRT